MARAEKPAAASQKKTNPMDATANLSPKFPRAPESKVRTTDRLLSRQVLQRIATRMSLVSQAIGFSILGILIILNRHQADLNGLAGGSSIAMVGGISALLVGAAFVVAACAHWRFCARRPVTLAVWRQRARFDFGWPEPAMAAVLS